MAEGYGIDLERRKKELIDVLTDRYASDELPVEEYERLVADIHRAVDPRELAVVGDIVSGSRREPNAVASGGSYAAAGPAHVQSEAAVLTERRHAGEWLRRRNVAASTVLASQIFDFRDITLPPGETLMELFVLLGSAEIIVPDDLAVRMEVVPVAGDATLGRGVLTREREGKPVLVLTGSVLLGSLALKAR